MPPRCHRAIRARLVPRPKPSRGIAEHKKIFEAVLGRDAKAALSALEQHYGKTAEHVIAALGHVPRLNSARAQINNRSSANGPCLSSGTSAISFWLGPRAAPGRGANPAATELRHVDC
jgi:hypothetical protein